MIASLSESDGGRFYMIPVCCHTIVRATLPGIAKLNVDTIIQATGNG